MHSQASHQEQLGSGRRRAVVDRALKIQFTVSGQRTTGKGPVSAWSHYLMFAQGPLSVQRVGQDPSLTHQVHAAETCISSGSFILVDHNCFDYACIAALLKLVKIISQF